MKSISFLFFTFLLLQVASLDAQGSILRFEYGAALSSTSLELLSDENQNGVVWLDGWHEGVKVNSLPEISKGENLFYIPNNNQISNLGKHDKYYKNLKQLNKALENSTENKLLTWPGCAGPEKEKIGDKLLLIYVDTEWFFHPNSRAEFSNTKCKTLWEADFWATLEDIVEDEEDRAVCIVGHHSIFQESAGQGSLSFLYPYYGPSSDFHSAIYKHLRHRMGKLLASNKNATYFSLNHAKNTDVRFSGEFFVKDYSHIDIESYEKGEIRIVGYQNNTEVILKRMQIADDSEKLIGRGSQLRSGALDTTVVVGAEYSASGFKSFWLGKNYRKEWETPVKLEKLYIDDISGGLTPYAKGGGLQTHSLKFKDPEGRKFAFRSVNKDAKKNKERIIMQTAVGEVKQDMISSQMPFGDVVVGKLLDHTDILHVNPRPFIMAGQKALGVFESDFTNVIGTLEEKPTKKNRNREGFAGADDIITTHEVFKKLLNNTKHEIDHEDFAKCIMFDIWIADWDRHHDNWKWAEYKDGKKRIYRPIPRDRDHAFALFEGVIGNISDVAAPNVAELSADIKDLKGMTFQGKNMLYFLGADISREEWNDAAEYLKTVFNRENIEKAWDGLPIEIQEFSREKIISALVSRKEDLPKVSNQLFDLFHEKAAFYASNKKDFLTIDATSNNEVLVSLYSNKKDKNKRKFVTQKVYSSKVTKQLEVYTLDGEDNIEIIGEGESGIDIILVPGTDKDEVKVLNESQKIRIVDTQKYEGSKSTVVDAPIYPDIYGFQYDALLPFLMYKFDSDYGSGFEVQLTKVNQEFNKKPFGRQTVVAAKFYPRGRAVRVRASTVFTDTWKDWDTKVKLRVARNDTRYDRYVGVNNVLPFDYRRNYRRGDDYYVQNDNIDIYSSMIKNFYGQSDVSFGAGTHYLDVKHGTGHTAEELLGDNDIWQVYTKGALNLDFTDNRNYPTKGVRYNVAGKVGYNLDANEGLFSSLQANVTGVNSWHDVSRSILLIKVGMEATVGNRSYIDYPILGNGNHVRGLANNLIRSSEIAYLNLEIRKEIHNNKNKYLPFLLGVTGFFDRGLSISESENNVSGYGGGIYLTFLNNAYTLFINKGFNNLDKRSIIHYGLGFSL